MKKILLLEDNPSDADFVSREIKIRWPDIELKVVSRLSEARKQMHSESNFDAAIFDLKLPDGNGMDLLSELRAHHCNIPIVILTREGSEEIAIAALKAGANDYISKRPGFQKKIPDQIEFIIQHALETRKHLSVLYVEHQRSDIDLTLHYLKKHAPYIHLKIVSTGEEALSLLPENNSALCDYDALLLDYRLTGLNAIEISKQIRQVRKLSIAIVIVTGQGDEDTAVEALKIGADDYIVKRDNYLFRLPWVLTSAYRRQELERQQKALKQSETKFRLLADYAADWEYWLNPEGKYIYISPVCEQISGYPVEAFEKNKDLLIEIAHANYREALAEHFTQKAKVLHKPIEFPIVTADGKEKWISHSCRPVYDEVNNYLGKRGVNRDITGQKLAAKALQESEEFVKRLIASSNDCIKVLDLEGNLLSMSAGGQKLLEIDDISIYLNKPWVDFWKGKDNEAALEAISTAKKGNVGKFSGFSPTEKGTPKWWEIIITPINNAQGNLESLLAISRDITERMQAVEVLLKMNKAIHNSSEVVFMTDKEGIITFINPEFTRMYGFTAEEVIGKVTPRILNSGHFKREEIEQFWNTLLNKQNIPAVQYINKCKDGKFIDVDGSADPIIDDNGNIIGFLAIQRDNTERKRAEKIQNVLYKISNAAITTDNLKDLISRIQEELGTIIDTANFYVALCDPKTDTLSLPFITDDKDKFTSFPAGKTLTNYVIGTQKPLLATQDIVKKLEKSGDIESFGADSEIWLGVPLKIKGKITGVLAVQSYTDENAYNESDLKMLEFVSDQVSISIDRKKAERDLINSLEKATESDRLKSAFLTNMSHEIRTPMNGILGFADLLKEPDLTGEQQQKYIGIIETSGHRMLNIINDLIDISKIESGLVEVNISEINVNEQIEYLFTFFKPEAEKKGLALSITSGLHLSEALINTDKEKIYAILTNLVKNAIKYTHEGSVEIGYQILVKTHGRASQQNTGLTSLEKANEPVELVSEPVELVSEPVELEFFV
nr:PAS domain S-box protein [Bacteroidota bacterium]